MAHLYVLTLQVGFEDEVKALNNTEAFLRLVKLLQNTINTKTYGDQIKEFPVA